MPRSPITRRPLAVTVLAALVVALLAAFLVRHDGPEVVRESALSSEQDAPSADLAPSDRTPSQTGTPASTSTPSAAPQVAAPTPEATVGATPTTGSPEGSAVLDTTLDAQADPTLTGAPPAAGLSAKPLRLVRVATSATLLAAIKDALPGDRIILAGGTYRGPFLVYRSGTADHPIVMVPEAGAQVTLTAPLTRPSCNATGPDPDRTIRFNAGASHWAVANMSIVGGVVMAGDQADASQAWQAQRIDSHNWQDRRLVPGAATRAPIVARQAVAWLSDRTGTHMTASDDIRLLNNTITVKGVFGRLTRYGVLSGNTVTNIACGTGPGVWFTNFSSGWTIRNNDVSRVADNTSIHYMQEGIRLGNGSNYNAVIGNVVHDLPTDSRAVTTDQDSSWNTFLRNRVSNVELAFNEQQSGWGNTWSYNTATNVRKAGFSFRMQDIRLTAPSYDTSSRLTVVTCNVVVTSTGPGRSMQAGAMGDATFSGNEFVDPYVGKALAGYWGKQGNKWNGKPTPPTDATPVAPQTGC